MISDGPEGRTYKLRDIQLQKGKDICRANKKRLTGETMFKVNMGRISRVLLVENAQKSPGRADRMDTQLRALFGDWEEPSIVCP